MGQVFKGTPPITLLSPSFAGTLPEYVVLTNGGAANTFGAWAQLGTLPPYKTNRLLLSGRPYTANSDFPGLINIGVGASGSQAVLVSSLLCNAFAANEAGPTNYILPIKMPPNQAIWAQYAQDTANSYTFELGGYAYDEPGAMETEQIVPFVSVSTSSGIVPTISSTSGAWGPLTLVSSTPQVFKGYFFSIFPKSTNANQKFSIEILVNGTVVFPNFVVLTTNAGYQVMTSAQWGPFPCAIPAGSSVTCQGYYSESVSAATIQIGFYGLA
jgi:hypothetical protein